MNKIVIVDYSSLILGTISELVEKKKRWGKKSVVVTCEHDQLEIHPK